MTTQEEKEFDVLSDPNGVGIAWHGEFIRSHRRQPDYSFRRVLIICVALTVLATELTTSTVQHPMMPTPHSVVVAVEDAQPRSVLVDPIFDDRAALRAGRDTARKSPPVVVVQRQTSKAEIAIAYALAQKGDRYRFGASGPNAFDCSGLVMMAFKAAGISLPHYTGAMISFGKRVSREDLQRGDIIFPASNHVAIYLGGGKQVVASSGSGKVIIQNVYAFYAARRLV